MELRNVADFIYKSFTRCGEKMEIHCWSITIKLTLQQSDYVTETLVWRREVVMIYHIATAAVK